MRWDRLFDDLEASAEAEDRAAFEAEIADLARAERAALSLADRLRAHVGHRLRLHVGAVGEVAGTVLDVGRDWVLVGPAGGVGTAALVPLGVVSGVDGLTRAAVAPPDPDAPPRLLLGLAVVLRALARDRGYVRVALRDGTTVGGTVDRVGADHLDVALHPPDEPRRASAVTGVRCIPLGALAVVRADVADEG